MIKLNIELDELLQSDKNSSKGLGRIWFQVDNLSFPEEKWFDFVFISLSEWTLALLNYSSNKEPSTYLMFIDGNYCLKVDRVDERYCNISLGKMDTFEEKFTALYPDVQCIEYRGLLEELLEANFRVIEFVRKHEIESQYFKSLLKWDHLIRSNKGAFL